MGPFSPTEAITPRSKVTLWLGHGFALVAALVSVMGANALSDDYQFNDATRWLLIALSALAVGYERLAGTLIRVRTARGDWRAAAAGRLLLYLMFTYTASMQLCFFGSTLLKPVAADQAVAQSSSDVAGAIRELEAKLARIPAPRASSIALKREVDSLERDAAQKGREQIKLREAAAALLPGKRAELSSAESYEELQAELKKLRGSRTELVGKAGKDYKAAIVNVVSFGLVSGEAHAISYVLVLLSVLMLQCAQILLPSVSGNAELMASQAKSVHFNPPISRQEPPPMTMQVRTPTLPKVSPPPAAPKPAPSSAPSTPPADVQPPAAPVLGPMAQRALALKEAEKVAKKNKRSKAQPPPASIGLASKVR